LKIHITSDFFSRPSRVGFAVSAFKVGNKAFKGLLIADAVMITIKVKRNQIITRAVKQNLFEFFG